MTTREHLKAAYKKGLLKNRIIYPPLTDEFEKYGDKFVKIGFNPANGMYCYRRTTIEGNIYYEMFKAPKRLGADGTKHPVYPHSSDFGFGVALCIRQNEDSEEKIKFYMRNGWGAGRWRKPKVK